MAMSVSVNNIVIGVVLVCIINPSYYQMVYWRLAPKLVWFNGRLRKVTKISC